MKRDDARDRDMVLAWHTAALSRAKDLPKLETLLTKRVATGKQSVGQHKAALQMLSMKYGIPLRKGKT